MPPDKPNWGGVRENSGRPKMSPEDRKPRRPSLTIVGTKTELNRLKAKAKDSGKDTSHFVLESLDCLDEQNKD